MYRREPDVGAIAFSRGGDPNVGEFKDAVILKTVGEVPTISNGSDVGLTRRKGEYSKSRLDREFPYQVMLPAERCRGVTGVAIQNFSRIRRSAPCIMWYCTSTNGISFTASPMRRSPISFERSSAARHLIHALGGAAGAGTYCAVPASTENVEGQP
jgi:hypothetical protein